MKRLTIALLGAALPLTSLIAQEAQENDTTILKNIEVVKEYNPVIKEAGKISTMPELKDIKVEKKESDISVWTTPYNLQPSNLPTLDFASLEEPAASKLKNSYAKIGAGNYISFLGELYTPFIQNNKNLLEFDVTHNSSFGMVNLTQKMYEELPNDIKSKATTNDTKAKLAYTRNLKNKELSTFVDGEFNFFKYYGLSTDMIQLADSVKETFNGDDKQHFTRIGANVRFRSKDYIGKEKYDMQITYRLFKNRDDLAEHTIHTYLYGAYRFEKSSLHIGFDMDNIIMNLPESTSQFNFEKGETLNNYTVIKIYPSYFFSGKSGEITIGVKGAFGIKQGKKGAVTPNVYGKAKIVPDVFAVYAGITGDYIVNNYQKTTRENQYIASDTRLQDTYMPIDAYVGTTVKIAKRVDFDIHAGYKLIENQYFYINKCDSLGNFQNKFGVVYDKNAGVFDAGMAVSYNWKDRLNLRFNGSFNKWAVSNIEEAWHMPKWKLNFEGSYLVNEQLRFHLGYLMEAGKIAALGYEKPGKKTSVFTELKRIELPTSHNLSVGANYRLLNWLDLFVNFDNIIGQEYQNWYGYTNHRFNFMAGASVVF